MADFQGQEKSAHAVLARLKVAVSTDGGDTWSSPHPIGAAANNGQRNPLDGCTIHTASDGTAYVFGIGTISSQGHTNFELMSTSTNGGGTWSAPIPVSGPVTQPGLFDPVLGRPTIDGIARRAKRPRSDAERGHRQRLTTGAGATNRIVMTYVSGSIDTQDVFFTESTDGGATWSNARAIESAGDHG